MPLASKIHSHSMAETTVGMAHGTRMLAPDEALAA